MFQEKLGPSWEVGKANQPCLNMPEICPHPCVPGILACLFGFGQRKLGPWRVRCQTLPAESHFLNRWPAVATASFSREGHGALLELQPTSRFGSSSPCKQQDLRGVATAQAFPLQVSKADCTGPSLEWPFGLRGADFPDMTNLVNGSSELNMSVSQNEGTPQNGWCHLPAPKKKKRFI